MSLRRRLITAQLMALVIGLSITSTLVYQLYASSLTDQIDKQLTSALPAVEQRGGLFPDLNGPPQGPPGFQFGGSFDQHHSLPSDAIAERLANNGGKIQPIDLFGSASSATVRFSHLVLPTNTSATFQTRAASNGSLYRISIIQTPDRTNYILLAIPLTSTERQLRLLLLIETGSGIALAGLAALIITVTLRRGLKPLELIAETADEIAGGNLSLRLETDSTDDETSRVERALNRMLDEIETAFRARDETEQTLRQFLADASHELRTPLTSIMGFAELFKLGAKDRPEDLETLLSRIVNESQRMSTLVEDLLLLARLDAKREPAPNPIDLSVIASEVVESFTVLNTDRRFSFKAGSPGHMEGDSTHIRQAITNLLSNAVKHTPAGTPIEVSLTEEPRDGLYTLLVVDHGPGLRNDAMAHIFDRFWQGDSSRGIQGTGLGLSIVKAVAEEHGGAVSASETIGGGATFSLSLPMTYQPSSASNTPRKSTYPPVEFEQNRTAPSRSRFDLHFLHRPRTSKKPTSSDTNLPL